MREIANRGIEDRRIIRIHDRLNREYLGMAAKRFHRPEHDALAADGSILLGAAGPGPEAASGRDEDGCSAVGSRH